MAKSPVDNCSFTDENEEMSPLESRSSTSNDSNSDKDDPPRMIEDHPNNNKILSQSLIDKLSDPRKILDVGL